MEKGEEDGGGGRRRERERVRRYRNEDKEEKTNMEEWDEDRGNVRKVSNEGTKRGGGKVRG
jgi:hypothetical protein